MFAPAQHQNKSENSSEGKSFSSGKGLAAPSRSVGRGLGAGAFGGSHGSRNAGGHLQLKAIADQSSRVQAPVQLMKAPQSQGAKSEVIQRETFAGKTDGAYSKRTHERFKGGTKVSEQGATDEKMRALWHFSEEVKKKLNDKDEDAGPHIAVSVKSGKLYVGVNSKFNAFTPKGATRRSRATQGSIEGAVDEVLKEWRAALPNIADGDLEGLDEATNAYRWITKTTSKHVIGDSEDGSEGSKHGELRVLEHILAHDAADRTTKNPADLKKVIRIGGTQLDCADCHQAMHGRFEDSGDTSTAKSSLKFRDQESYDEKFGKLGYAVMTGPSHGKSFPGWLHPQGGDKTASMSSVKKGSGNNNRFVADGNHLNTAKVGLAAAIKRREEARARLSSDAAGGKDAKPKEATAVK